jgi:hypothetical protein
MQLKDTQDALNAFGKYVVQQSRSKLTKGRKNASNALYNSLGYDLKVMPNSFSMAFLMEEYGEYQDKGVRGVGGPRKTTSRFNKNNNKGKIWKQKGGNSPFSFKEGRKPSVKHFEAWSRSKGLSAFAVRESVYSKKVLNRVCFLPNHLRQRLRICQTIL